MVGVAAGLLAVVVAMAAATVFHKALPAEAAVTSHTRLFLVGA